MDYIPPGEEREIKVDILEMVLYDDAVKPNEISLLTIENGVARHERETVLRWVDELITNPDCPLEYSNEDQSAVWLSDRARATLFIDSLKGDPWYQPDLD